MDRHGPWFFGIAIYAMPVFFLGLMAQLFFGVLLDCLPTSGQASPITQASSNAHEHPFLSTQSRMERAL